MLENRAEFKESESEMAVFKPIKAVSKTYEDKDIGREFFEKFIKVEHERGR
ncbi:MAG: hypothetical protein ACTTJC_03955 [Campylobacter sp.]